uniref:C3H1-type domain-containing protein n=1 Tax=Chenopodium quinoa TaxID=63459 RepID=A0A803MER6_CHEQI
MPIKKEPCRNFLRGSCRFGDKCKFSHATQQQPKSNAFGFGSQTATPFQQQKPNPFGFGVQNSGSSGGFGQPNSNKPFENKWVRSEQPQNQSQAASHKCTDPDSCKRQIAEDFQNESPLWKLTCYGHFKYFPCDITGDISYEELRAVAYDDAKRGTSLQSIVSLLPSLLNEALICSLPSTPSNSAFGQSQGPGPFGGNSAPSGPFGTQVSAQPGGILPAANKSGFGNSGMSSQGIFGTQVPAQPGGSFAANTSGFFGNSAMRGQEAGGNTFTPPAVGFGNIGMNNQGPQVPVQTGGAPITSNAGGFGNSGINSQGSQLPSTSSVSLDIQTPAVNNSTTTFNGFVGANGVQQTIDNNPLEISAVDASIWLKQEWKLGERPDILGYSEI